MADHAETGFVPPRWDKTQVLNFLQMHREILREWPIGTAPAGVPDFDALFPEARQNIMHLARGYSTPDHMLNQLRAVVEAARASGNPTADAERSQMLDLIDEHVQHVGFPRMPQRDDFSWMERRGRNVRNAGRRSWRKVAPLSPFFDPTREGFDGRDGWFWNITGIFKDYFYVWWLFDSMEDFKEVAANPRNYPTSRPWSKPFYTEMPNKDTARVLANEHHREGRVEGQFLGWCGIAPGGKTFQRAIPMTALEGIDLKGKVFALGAARRRMFKGMIGNTDYEALLWNWDGWPKEGGDGPEDPKDCKVKGRVVDFAQAYNNVPAFAAIFNPGVAGPPYPPPTQAMFERCYMLQDKIDAAIATALMQNPAALGGANIGVDEPTVTPYKDSVTTLLAFGAVKGDAQGYFECDVTSGDIELFGKKSGYRHTTRSINSVDYPGTPHIWALDREDVNPGLYHRFIHLNAGETKEENIIVLWKPPPSGPKVLTDATVVPVANHKETNAARRPHVCNNPFGQNRPRSFDTGIALLSATEGELSFSMDFKPHDFDTPAHVEIECFIVYVAPLGMGVDADDGQLAAPFIQLMHPHTFINPEITYYYNSADPSGSRRVGMGAFNMFTPPAVGATPDYTVPPSFPAGVMPQQAFGARFQSEDGIKQTVGVSFKIGASPVVPPYGVWPAFGHFRIYCVLKKEDPATNAPHVLNPQDYRDIFSETTGACVNKLYDFNYIPFKISK